MTPATVMPTWLVIALAIGMPLLTFAAAVAGNVVTRRGARELESRSRREETMRHLKWAAELAVSEDERRAALGIRELKVLSSSHLPDPELQAFVTAAMEAAYANGEAVVDEARRIGESVAATWTPRSAEARTAEADRTARPSYDGTGGRQP